ncbi:16S rRNA (uracil(1498)-N(3))-methyltransferase [bacterium]|nr:16S rRNA (uracil(1498)-N(3))-methyltransferase [bacterium]
MLPHITTFFYTPPNLVKKGIIRIRGDEVKHITKVLRKTKGEIIYVTDGVGSLYKAEITGIESKELRCEIREKVDVYTEIPFDITLAVGSLRQKNMEQIIDQATQLGIRRFFPLISDYEVFKYRDEAHIESLLARWEKIAIRAMKQSFRTNLPIIETPDTIDNYLKNNDFDMKFFADPEGLPNAPIQKVKPDSSVFLAIGSEGGFSSTEKKLLEEWDCIPIMLGNRRLRTETAAIILISKILIWLKEL